MEELTLVPAAAVGAKLVIAMTARHWLIAMMTILVATMIKLRVVIKTMVIVRVTKLRREVVKCGGEVLN